MNPLDSAARGYTPEEAAQRWDAVAKEYADRCSKYGDINKDAVLIPVIMRMLGPVSGKTILDAGCGEGFLSRLLAEQGASVVAVDYSQEMLEIARQRTPKRLGIDYQHANIESLALFEDGAFDIVVSSCVIHDLPDYQSAIQEMHRVLVPTGVFILAMMHPCFSSQGQWIRDSKGNKLYWKVDGYFYEGGFEEAWLPRSDKKLIYFHRTLSSYFKTITGAGFSVEEVVEPKPSEETIKKHPGFADDLRMSHFIVFRLAKGA